VERAADVVVVAAWLGVAAHNGWLALRGVRRERSPAGWVVGAALVLVVLGAGTLLEGASGGRWHAPLVVTGAGVVAVVAGTVLHAWARATIGRQWAVRADRAGSVLVDSGPYGRIRHPIYAGVLLLGVGTCAAHPSAATASGLLGLVAGTVLKIRAEEQALARALGPAWTSYRTRVPCIFPGFGFTRRD
jgi:protein-S-isoprenylcysteine O-methyltransferase Ste14